MILSSHTTICDGCGALGPTSDRSAAHAVTRAMAEGWTRGLPPGQPLKHWCPACTEARKES